MHSAQHTRYCTAAHQFTSSNPFLHDRCAEWWHAKDEGCGRACFRAFSRGLPALALTHSVEAQLMCSSRSAACCTVAIENVDRLVSEGRCCSRRIPVKLGRYGVCSCSCSFGTCCSSWRQRRARRTRSTCPPSVSPAGLLAETCVSSDERWLQPSA